MARLVRAALQAFTPHLFRPFALAEGGGVPPSIRSVLTELSSVTMADLGLDTDPRFPWLHKKGTASKAKPNLTPTCVYLHDSDAVTIAAFLLPAHTSLPLHDHPGMWVACRVLHGEMQVTSYDFEDTDHFRVLREEEESRLPSTILHSQSLQGPEKAQYPGVCVASRETLGPASSPKLFTPLAGGCLHTMTSLTDCVFLDVIAPPYDTALRQCTYFRPLPRAAPPPAQPPGTQWYPSRGERVLLEVQPQPADFVCPGHYSTCYIDVEDVLDVSLP